MALARVKTWNPGDTLTAADLNGEFNNILNNPITLVSPTTGAINFQTSVAHTNLQPAALTASSGTRGQALMVTSSAGSQWSNLGVGSRVKNLSGLVTSSQTATLTAEEYLLRTSDALNPASYLLTSTAAFTVNVGTAGPAVNGRDVSAVFSSTYIHLYAITTGLGSTTPAGIASSTPSPTGPVLPTSYSAWTYLGTYPYSSSSTSFAAPMRPRGAWINYESEQSVLTGGAASSETVISILTQVPSNAVAFDSRIVLRNITIGTGSAAQINASFRVVAGSTYTRLLLGLPLASINPVVEKNVIFPNVAQTFLYVKDTDPAGTNGVDAYINGYKVPNGDV